MPTITHLSEILNRWIRRLRAQRALTWALRGFTIGLAGALLVGWIGLFQARLLREEYLSLIVFASVSFALASSLIGFFWPVQPLRAARQFDLLFHLGERVSTALELQEGHQLQALTEMRSRQLQDAVAAARTVDARNQLPLRFPFREVIPSLLLILMIGAVWFRGDQWFNAARQARTVKREVAEQLLKIEKLSNEIATNNELSPEQKQLLTDPLKEAQQSLQNDPSLSNSVSMLTSTREKLQSLSNAQSRQMQQSLQGAGNELAQQNGSALQSVGKALAQGNLVSAASQLKNIHVDKLSPAERQQLADQLDTLANALQSNNPELASQLRQAANAIRSGDTVAAQQALDSAAKSLALAGQQITFSQTASQAASQLQQGAGQVLAAGGGQQAAQQGAGLTPNQQANGSSGSGTGLGSGDPQDPQSGSEAGTLPIDQNNGPGDSGETSYEQIYAPALLGGDGGPQVGLPNSGNENGEVVGQGPTTPGDPGTSSVPYNEVYSQYEQINNQAIENGEVPSQFIEIIKNYFDSLKP